MPHGHLQRGTQVHHLTFFNAIEDQERARRLARFELQHFPANTLSPDEMVLAGRDWMQYLVGLDRNPPAVFGYLSVSTWAARQ